MTSEPSEGGTRRVRRPADKDDLIESLRAKSGGAFSEIRDVLLFASAVGFAEKRFAPFDKGAGEAIRWETFVNRWFAEDFVRLVAVAHADDKEIASADRVNEQIAIFEGYANGGLAVLQEHLDRLQLEEPLEAVLEVLGTAQGQAKGVDILIGMAEDPDL